MAVHAAIIRRLLAASLLVFVVLLAGCSGNSRPLASEPNETSSSATPARTSHGDGSIDGDPADSGGWEYATIDSFTLDFPKMPDGPATRHETDVIGNFTHARITARFYVGPTLITGAVLIDPNDFPALVTAEGDREVSRLQYTCTLCSSFPPGQTPSQTHDEMVAVGPMPAKLHFSTHSWGDLSVAVTLESAQQTNATLTPEA